MLNDWLLVVLLVSAIALVFRGIRRRSVVYEFHFLFGWATLGFVVLQLAGIRNDPMVPAEGTSIALIMAILSCWMVYWGHIAARSAGPIEVHWAFYDRYLIVGAIFLTLVGAAFMLLVYRLGPAQVESQWTGPITIYYFLARCAVYALIIACIVFLRTGSRVALAIVCIVIALYMERFIISGRRGDLIEIALIPLLALWFQRRVAVPRTLVIGGIVMMTLLIHSIGDYRGRVRDEGPIEAFKNVEWSENLKSLYQQGGGEMKNAAFKLSATNLKGNYDLGAFHWNVLIHSYVPGQLIGQNFKRDIMFEIEDSAYEEYGYQPISGSTSGGLTDAYGSFWYFGALLFFAISYVMTRLFISGSRENVMAQIFYMGCIGGALHTVTHHTGSFYVAFINVVLFVLPFLLLARRGGILRRIAVGFSSHQDLR